MNHDERVLAGTVGKKPGATTTAFSHLEIVFCDGSNGVLQTRFTGFTPRSVGDSRFSSHTAYFSLPVESLPAGTVRIIVRARDQPVAPSVNSVFTQGVTLTVGGVAGQHTVTYAPLKGEGDAHGPHLALQTCGARLRR